MQVMINAIATGRNDSEQDAYSKEEQLRSSSTPVPHKTYATALHCPAVPMYNIGAYSLRQVHLIHYLVPLLRQRIRRSRRSLTTQVARSLHI